MEKISVIIPTYNRADVLERAVQSVLRQTYTNLEIIIVDDGSTDDTEQLIVQMKDERIRYIKQGANSGVAMARNTGVMHATAELIAFQDSDDYWYANKLEKQMEYWKMHPEWGMVYSAYRMCRANGQKLKVPAEGLWGALEGNIFSTILVNNTVGAPTMLLRKECFQKIGGFDTELECIEDWDFTLRFAEQYTIGYVQEMLVDAHQSLGGVSSRTAEFFDVRCRMIARYKQELIERGLFDKAAGDLLVRAQKTGMLELVKKMLMVYLQG